MMIGSKVLAAKYQSNIREDIKMLKNKAKQGIASELVRLVRDESAVGVIEVVLILVVLIGLVAVFKTQINDLLTNIFGSITSMSDDIL